MALVTTRRRATIEDAKARAHDMHVRTMAVPGRERRQYFTLSQSQDDVQYTMTRQDNGWTCSCKGFFYGHTCKHLGALALRAEREGWDFGRIAGNEFPRVDLETGEILD